MTEIAERNRPRLPENDRREIAKRIFDALCAKFPKNTSHWSSRAAIQIPRPKLDYHKKDELLFSTRR